MTPDILFEDQDILVLNKPAGLVVNQAETAPVGTLQAWCAEQPWQSVWPTDWATLVPADFESTYGTPEVIFASRQGVVHRLDKDTSGVLILAKHPGSLVALLAEFRERRVSKSYVALLHGQLKVLEETISAPISRGTKDRQRFVVDPAGRSATTQYKVEQLYADLNWSAVAGDKQFVTAAKRAYQGFSLVECWPLTGRTHQIRVHFNYLHHPLVGDALYLGRKRARLDYVWAPRQCLHAKQLEIQHPRNREKITTSAPLAEDLQQVLSLLTPA
jgi:23S rRNA pseudouridine1911/1915/1917 synthase